MMFISWLREKTVQFITILLNKWYGQDDTLITKNKLNSVPKELLNINIYQYYLSLYQQLMSINSDHNKQGCPEHGPFVFHFITVENNGLLVINRSVDLRISYTPNEAKKIAIAIYQLAYAYTLTPKNTDVRLLSMGIGHFLMRPFVALHGTDDVRTINNYFRQLTHTFRNKKVVDVITKEEKYASSALVIQRLFRLHLFKQHEKKIQPVSERLKLSMGEHGVSIHPQTPNVVLPLTKDEKLKWINSVKPNLKEFARKIAFNLISYRSHPQFIKQLSLVVAQFNGYLHSLPMEQRNYVIIVPDKGTFKSNHWVTALAMPLLIIKPEGILYSEEVYTYKKNNPALKHVVFFDDALYSGRQMRELIYNTSVYGLDLNKILIIPFYTKRIAELQRTMRCFIGELMLTPYDLQQKTDISPTLWTEEDNQRFDHIISNEWNSPSAKVGTFFNHRVADQASTFLNDLGILHKKNGLLIPETLKFRRSQVYYG